MTLKLCGFSASNYYNKIKLQLLEKGVAFEEELVWTGNSNTLLVDRSPMGKVPFLDTPNGPISESMACAEYIEQAYSLRPLLPQDAYAAAKVRELIIYVELHIELVARQLYAEAFFGGKVSEGTKEKVRQLLIKGVSGLAKLVKFSPFIAGPQLTLADCAAMAHLPLVSTVSKMMYGEDLLASLPAHDYLRLMSERPTVGRVNADRKSNTALLMSSLGAKKT